MLTEYHNHEMATASECKLRNALKFGTAGEVDSQEGHAPAEGLLALQPNSCEDGTPPVELNRAVGEALISQPPPQCPRTKLIFDVRTDNPFLD